MNKLTEFGWHWILPIKDQAPNLRKAIVAHLKVYKSPPGHFQDTAGKRRLRVTHRDDQWCRFWDSYSHPHRILSFTETDIDSGTTFENLTFITSVSAEVMSTRTLWSCAHKRWFIENQGFHVLKHTSSLTFGRHLQRTVYPRLVAKTRLSGGGPGLAICGIAQQKVIHNAGKRIGSSEHHSLAGNMLENPVCGFPVPDW